MFEWKQAENFEL